MRFYLVLAVAMLLFFARTGQGQAASFSREAGIRHPTALEEFEFGVSQLPDQGPQARQIVEQLRERLEPDTGKGQALVDTSAWLPPELLARFAAELPEGAQQIWLKPDPAEVVRTFPGRQEITPLAAAKRKALWTYIDWITRMTNEALAPQEELIAQAADIRLGDAISVPDFHEDGSYMSANVALRGPNTLYFEDNPKLPRGYTRNDAVYSETKAMMNRRADFHKPPAGAALIFSCSDRAYRFDKVCETWHATPPQDKERALLLIRYHRVP